MSVRATLALLLLVCLAGPKVFAADESLLLEEPPTKSVGEDLWVGSARQDPDSKNAS
jgi:hypothetical protein